MAMLTQNLLGQSPAWLATLDLISGLAAVEKPVLVVGERGTGKTLVAGRLHFLSPRWEQNWQTINCAAFNEKGLDAQWFGGAGYNQECLLEAANDGTLFLDNIEAMPLGVQKMLLDVIETGTDSTANDIDVRIVAASAVDLPRLVKAGRFCADLLDVLAFDVISLPPLRVRGADILTLAEHFAAKMVADLDEDGFPGFPGFSAEVREFLAGYAWPGNVRELKTVVERAVGRAWNEDGGLDAAISQINIDPFEAPWRLGGGRRAENQSDGLQIAPEQAPSPQTKGTAQTTQEQGFTNRTDAFELSLIHEALTQAKNHQGKAAKYLGLSYHQFRGLLRKHGLKK